MVLNSGIDILIFQKVFDETAISFAKRAREKGIKTVFVLSDKHDTEMVRVVDLLIVTSDFLKFHFDQNFSTNSIVIEDALEVPRDLYKEHTNNSTLQLVWVGHRDNWQTVEIISDVIANLCSRSLKLKTISNHEKANVQWDINTVFSEILACDIAVIPALDNDWGLSKSNNRLTMFMALGMPVVASMIPSYVPIVKNGNSGFLATSREEWMKYLLELSDVDKRKVIGAKARLDVRDKYSMDTIGASWVSALKQLINYRPN